MVLVLGSFFDPEAEGLFFFFGETIGGIEWRHVVVSVRGEDAGNELGFVGLAWDDGVEFSGPFEGVEAEIGLAFFFVEPVAEEAIVREDGANVPVVADFLRRREKRGE